MSSVTSPVVPPPFRPVPAVTAVMSPPLPALVSSVAQIQAKATLSHLATSPLAQDRPARVSSSTPSANPAGVSVMPPHATSPATVEVVA